MNETQAMSRTPSESTRASLKATVGAVLACAAGAMSFAANALPVLPQGAGYGMDTPAGRGGTVHRVTNLNASGARLFQGVRRCDAARACACSRSRARSALRPTSASPIRTSRLPARLRRLLGSCSEAAALRISTSDVLVQHLRVRVGGEPGGPALGNRDALKIESPPTRPIKNIVVDHCSFSWATR